ncbi:MAG TPA: hypothetical protein VL371_03465 [Gemmataceae bacterium]|nr:hypothetical protein [Gemmataceae bacterium]
MSSPKVRLRVEELGSRVLPSRSPLPAGHVADMTHRAAVSPRPAATPVNLHGALQGTLFQVIRGPIDLGIQYGLTGAGELGGQLRFQVTGGLRRVGFIAQGQATGALTLTNAQGSITLSLVGPTQPGFAPLPAGFHYTVTGGTGAYQGATGEGQVTLRTRPVGGLALFTLDFA